MPPEVPATVNAGVVVGVATEIMPPVKPTLVTVPAADQVPSPRKYVVADGVPVTGLVKLVAELMTYPLVGSVKLVEAVTASVVGKAPDRVRLPPM